MVKYDTDVKEGKQNADPRYDNSVPSSSLDTDTTAELNGWDIYYDRVCDCCTMWLDGVKDWNLGFLAVRAFGTHFPNI